MLKALIRRQFFLAYRSLCPSAWTQRWDDQRGECGVSSEVAVLILLDNGTFPTRLDE